WFGSRTPTGVRPSAVPLPDTSVPPVTAPSKVTGGLPTPVSMTAIVTPLPRVTCQASRMRAPSSQYSFARTGSLGSSGTGEVGSGVGVSSTVGAMTAGTVDAANAG